MVVAINIRMFEIRDNFLHLLVATLSFLFNELVFSIIYLIVIIIEIPIMKYSNK